MKIYQWLTFVLLAVVVALIFLWPKPKPSQREVELIQSNELLEAKAANAVKASQAIVLKLEQDSLESLEAANRFKKENSALRKRIAAIRPRVEKILIENPPVDSLVIAQDSLIDIQALRIDSLTIERQVMGKSYTFLVAAKDQELAAMREINTNLDQILEINKRDLRRARRGNKLWKGLAIVGTVGGIFLGSR